MGKQKRKFSPDFKLKICQDIETGVKTRNEIIQENDLVESVVAKWLTKYRIGGVTAFNHSRNGLSETTLLKKQITELEKLLGRKTMEIEVLKEAHKLADLKKGIHTSL